MSEEPMQYPWLFKGAYATYHGVCKVKRAPAEFEITSKMEVEDIDLANKRVKIRIRSTAFMKRFWRTKKKEEDVAAWVKIGDRLIPSDTPYNLEGEYERVMRFEGLGIRKCIAQVCSLPKSTMIVLWDKEYNWPLAFISVYLHRRKTVIDLMGALSGLPLGRIQDILGIREIREYSFPITLRETNIPGFQL